MALERRRHMDFVRRIAPEHFILGDQSLGTFGEKYFVAELDRCTHLAALDQVGVRFEDGIYFGHLEK